MKLGKLAMIAVAALVLTSGLAMQFLHVPNVKDGRLGGGAASGQLAQLLPTQAGPWVAVDEPLGPNESVSDAASRILNFDDYVFRTFRQGGRSLSVYIAYWAPGRMPTHKVASHTPDRCWVENGWTVRDARFAVPVSAGGAEFKRGEWRLFHPPAAATDQFVVYWHLVGDELYDYGARLNTKPHPVKWVRDSLAYAMKGSEGQYFIRLTSDRPIEEFFADSSLADLWRVLGGLGLANVPGGVAAGG